jgi:glycosyltransferase involved in cell wall biosynthesis
MKIVILSSHTNSLFWFRLDFMKELIKKGYDVIAVGSESEIVWKEKFSFYGIVYKQIRVSRNGLNPLNDLNTFSDIYKLLKTEKPDKVFIYQAKTIIYGTIACKLLKTNDVHILIAGLGSIFRGIGIKNSVIKKIMSLQYKIACSFSKTVIFQNDDDRSELIKLRIVDSKKTRIINGSGVNLNVFKPTSLPNEPVFLMISRLIKDKGIMEYLNAAKLVKSKYQHSRFLLVGPFDSNPSAISESELLPYIESGTIEYFGEQANVQEYLSMCNVYVLPSYHEGTPKTVLEAMAMGRPIITTDAPGCRETVIDGENGFLVPVKDVVELGNKMIYFIENPIKVDEMSLVSLEIVRSKYDVRIINSNLIDILEKGEHYESI